MDIRLTSEELKRLDISSIPNGTNILEFDDENSKPIKSYLVVEDKLSEKRDFVEEDRDWLPGEEKKFAEGKTKEEVFDFFLKHDDTGPQREWRTMTFLEGKYFSFIRHDGTYKFLDNYNTYNYFKIKICKNSNLDKALGEIDWAINRIADFHAEVNPIELKISEHTLSEFGIYSVLWNRKKTFKLYKTTYGSHSIVQEFDSLEELIKYIADHHYYE